VLLGGEYENGLDEKLQLLIFSLVLSTNSKRILELGTREWCSALALLAGVKCLGGTVTSVDINPNITFRCPDDLNPYWEFIVSDALNFLEGNTKSYDLIYIDDWHSCPHVLKELELLKEYITPSTIILMHDAMVNSWPEYNLFEGHPDNGEHGEGGVAQALFDLDLSVWEYSTIPIQHGLTILRKK